MKKLIKSIIRFVLILCFVGLCLTGLDYYRMTRGELPIFNLSSYQAKRHTQYFYGPFYVAERRVRASTVEPLSDSSKIRFKILFVTLDIPRVYKEETLDLSLDTKKQDTCTKSVLYYADLSMKVYTYCLDEINVKKDNNTQSLLTYLGEDTAILKDIDQKLGYQGYIEKGKAMEYDSLEDSFTNEGLRMIYCSVDNIKDVYIGPKDMEFQADFCTYKDDDFKFIYEIDDRTPASLEAIKNEKGEVVPEVLYEDETYRYEFDLPKSNYVFITTPAVRGKAATSTPIREILTSRALSIEEIIEKGLEINKIDKEEERKRLEEEKKKLEEEKVHPENVPNE